MSAALNQYGTVAFRHPKAACVGATDIFFCEIGDPYLMKKIKRAKKACAGCEALEACKQYLLDQPGPPQLGIWAGMNHKDIQKFRRQHGVSRVRAS
jgi:hypothetical protein